MRQKFDFSLNQKKMHDLDLHKLLECAEENIENSALFACSDQLLGIIDNRISAIDEKLHRKHNRRYR